MTILECTTGNAGIACAAVAAIEGYRCTVIMPEGMGEERKKLIEAYGAELILTPGGESDVDVALALMEEMRAAHPERYFVPAEFENPDNIEGAPHDHRARDLGADAGTRRRRRRRAGDGRLDQRRRTLPEGAWAAARVYAAEPAECG